MVAAGAAVALAGAGIVAVEGCYKQDEQARDGQGHLDHSRPLRLDKL